MNVMTLLVGAAVMLTFGFFLDNRSIISGGLVLMWMGLAGL